MTERRTARLRLETWLHARREAWRAAFVRGPASAFLFEFASFGAWRLLMLISFAPVAALHAGDMRTPARRN